METVMFVAQSSGHPSPGPDSDAATRPVDADEIWDFCAHGIVGA